MFMKLINENVLKGKFILIILFCISTKLFSLDFSNLDGRYYRESHGMRDQSLSFEGNKLTYILEDYIDGNFVTKNISNKEFSITNKYGLDYIKILDTDIEWLMLYSEYFIMLYDKDGMPFFRGENRNITNPIAVDLIDMRTPFFLSTDSHLVEKSNGIKTKYPISNLKLSGKIPFPWVEGEDGYGIGLKLNGIVDKRLDNTKVFLFFSNGYVSYNRPDLYQKNSRVKEILVKNLSTLIENKITLEDVAHYQIIDLSNIITSTPQEIELIITDVYKGSDWADTCINQIFTFIPFDSSWGENQ